MKYKETPDDVLEQYTKQRCDEIENMYDDLKKSIVQIMTTKDELEKFNIMSRISAIITKLSYEHIDTLDRYLYAYEGNKRLENIISDLKKDEES